MTYWLIVINYFDTNIAPIAHQVFAISDDNYNIYRLHGIIKAKSGDMYYADDLNDYGCWCGQNGQGQPLDELDR